MAVLVRKSMTRGNGGGHGPCLVPGLDLRAGQMIAGKYRVDELLGTGASGVVLAAHSVHLRQPVSLKILASYTDAQEEALARRVQKARMAASLRSAHVARILDIGVTEHGMPYVATEALTGVTLAEELETRGKLPVDEAVSRALEICEGLAEAHAMGLVHGDLKPGNVFLAERSGARVLQILDFGSTSPLEAIGDQSTSAFFGSPAFLAPEQIKDAGAADARADIWAVGVLLHNLISGELPFTADTVSGVLVAVVYDAPPLLTDAPYELSRIVHRCLDKDPAQRPSDVGELARLLAPFAPSEGARASERVRVALEAAPSPSIADASASASVAPVSMSIEVPAGDDADAVLPLVSARPRARLSRPRRPRAAVATLLVIVASLAGVSFTSTPGSRLEGAPAPAEIEPPREDTTVLPLAPRLEPSPAAPPAPAPASPTAARAPQKPPTLLPPPPLRKPPAQKQAVPPPLVTRGRPALPTRLPPPSPPRRTHDHPSLRNSFNGKK